MASAQMLSNPATSVRKKEHLEAGKRRLEEFRKKRAADQAKKAGPASHLYPANVDFHGQQPLDNQHVRLTDSNGAVRSDGVSETIVEPSREVSDDENKANEFVQNNELASYDTHANPPFQTNYYNSLSGETVQVPAKDQGFDTHNALKFSGTANVNYSFQPREKNDNFGISMGASDRHVYGSGTDQSVPSGSRLIFDDSSDHPSSYGLEEAHSNDIDTNMKDFRVNPDTSHATDSKHSDTLSSSYTSRRASGLASSLYEDSAQPPIKIIEPSSEVRESTHAVPYSNDTSTFNMGGRMIGDSVSQFPSGNSIPLWLSESRSTAFSHGVNSSANHESLYPAVAETNTRRSRPSFLDAVTLPKVPVSDAGRVESFSSKIHEMDMASSGSQKLFSDNTTIQPFSMLRAPNVSSASVYSMTSSVSAGNVPDMYGHDVNLNSMERKHDSYLRKQDEDFAALEQHIEDLTQEKFSLQRALEASRTLADSLASENSSLTDSYNQQGSVVSQLKSDMEMLQAEIKTQLMELEAIKMEFANVHLECNAADERAKLLASEVIGLEEKALRLRSSELKLERQLENSQAEISSCKKKISSLEKDRQDLQATIDALQEEKKLLQAKLRKASASGKFIDVSKSLSNKKDVSTSTEDLIHEDDANTTAESSTMEMHSGAHLLGTNASSSSLLPENGQFNLEASYLNIPPDQMRTIQNINTLISELALEKEELMEALLAESSGSSKLKELNNELSRKLEAQTQRLELLTAQSMANVNTPTRPLDPRSTPDNTPYADEGDEVVERVLGWIMKLFPGGPSKRRTSKLL